LVTILRLLYCALGCVLGGAMLDGAALAFALAFAFFFFFGVVSAPGVAGGALVLAKPVIDITDWLWSAAVGCGSFEARGR
jgi:hypothetical protein